MGVFKDLTRFRKTYSYYRTVPIVMATSGDITAVYAGTSLTGGGTNGDVTLNLDSTISVDVINERTSGSGVTIDGVLLKDGVVSGMPAYLSGDFTPRQLTGDVIGTTKSTFGNSAAQLNILANTLNTGDVVTAYYNIKRVSGTGGSFLIGAEITGGITVLETATIPWGATTGTLSVKIDIIVTGPAGPAVPVIFHCHVAPDLGSGGGSWTSAYRATVDTTSLLRVSPTFQFEAPGVYDAGDVVEREYFFAHIKKSGI